VDALRLGATLYAESSGAFADRVETYWNLAGQLGPERPAHGLPSSPPPSS
jgi:hypothetical protein